MGNNLYSYGIFKARGPPMNQVPVQFQARLSWTAAPENLQGPFYCCLMAFACIVLGVSEKVTMRMLITNVAFSTWILIEIICWRTSSKLSRYGHTAVERSIKKIHRFIKRLC